jgi:hypothetical protein
MRARAAKDRAIAKAVRQGAPLEQLRHLCISKYGLVSDLRRIEVWPKLLAAYSAAKALDPAPNPHSEQIEKDCDRSLHQFDVTSNISAKVKVHKQKQLSRILNSVFANDPSLHYYQGFNDVASVFLMVLGESHGQHLALQSAYLFLRYPLDCANE